ncbi:flagellar basal-body rod protein FlgB [Methylomagnum ishizawai]|uniref:Flagellar basal body rod protein FlgB n=1 Tax=Methylomagnum ishizawai TaxID=1760988 RepID=A0A1Y6CZQ3_9GAMM|nr:flagellar basal body rod protein FlgB [Methylomagnum ishizawai]SMF95796.1 flagellar basal-body rod protein FlgB [Methylomagnum ishizawai]
MGSISFANALGIHPLALKLRDRRTELLASNLANVDTPHYKARDIDFRKVLKGVTDPDPALGLSLTHPAHIDIDPIPKEPPTLYRIPAQPSMDGNTVESEQEHVRFGENALQYEASLNFVGSDFAGLKTAIKGE